MRACAALLAALLLALISRPGFAEEDAASALLDRAGLSGLAALSEALEGPDVRAIAADALSGRLEIDPDAPARALRQFADALKSALLQALGALAAPVLATLGLRLLLDAKAGPLTLLCRMACACALCRQCAAAMALARTWLEAAARIAGVASPVMAAALTLTGRTASAAALTPLTALCVDGIERALTALGLPLCGIAAIVAAGGFLSDRFRLDRLFRLLCRTVAWGARLVVAGFVGLMALQGRLAAAGDGVAAQAARKALRGLIPLIGGSVSDSSGALAESTLAARNALGVTGVVVALGVAAKPALRLWAHMLSLKLAAALAEPVADPGIARIAAGYGEIARLLLALCAAGALLAALLAGAGLGVMGF